MKTHLLLFFLISSLPLFLFAQKKKGSIYIKQYIGLNYQTSALTKFYIDNQPLLAFSKPSKTISFFDEEGHFREIGRLVTRSSWSRRRRGFLINNNPYITRLNVSIFMEQAYRLISNKNQKVVPYLGVSFNPYFDQFNTPDATIISQGFVVRSTTVGFFWGIVPRTIFHINDRFLIDVNLPIQWANIYWEDSYVSFFTFPPPENDRSSYGVKAEFFQTFFFLRVGLGVKIG